MTPKQLTIPIIKLDGKMERETASLRWEGKKVAQVNGVTAEQIWSVVSDFCNIHKWLPTIDTCYRVEGTDGQPGLVRYCTSTKTKDEEETKWARERLVKIDPVERCLSYEVLENNVGFRSYVATVKVTTVDGGDESDGGKVCLLEWSFASDPVDGWKKEDLESFVDFFLKHWASKMEMNL
ncbi:lachrymatory-factor synthase-like [Brassica napus]|uniref:lachrymatory-factor synthase-like n=1 Tax=Brassica napus TaxID=3708 RepID=UPI000BBE5F91|nr:lachrymatory-factor synthase-like [Brassica napus]